MMWRKYFCFIFPFSFLLFSFSFSLRAQDTTSVQSENELKDKIENIGGETEDDVDFTNLLEHFDYLKQHPLNVNSATRDELEQLGLLDEFRINSLFDHIHRHGKLLAIYELQSINGYDLETIYKILPYVRISNTFSTETFSPKDVFLEGKSYVLVRGQVLFQKASAYTPPSDSVVITNLNSLYLGSPFKEYIKYRFNFRDNISFGITGEKDAGEVFFRQKVDSRNHLDSLQDSILTKFHLYNKGFDFFSAHLFYKSTGLIRAIALGDYELQYGQGLCMWSGLSFRKSADVMNIRRNTSGIKPYTSVNENLFMRGAATAVGYKNIQADVFFSQHKIDGNVTVMDSTDDEALQVSSFETSGYHRTPAELEDRDAVKLSLYGSHLAYKTKKINIGATAVKSLYSVDLVKASSPYNYFDFAGNENSNLGIDYSFYIKNMSFFGEAASSESGGKAFVNGFLVSLDQFISVGAVHRNYEKDYHGLVSNGFSETAGTKNEKGTYLSVNAKPVRGVTLDGYYDIFSYPWLKYQVDAPSGGYDYLTQITFSPSKKTQLYVRYTEKLKQENAPSGSGEITNPLVSVKKQKIRLNVDYSLSASFSFDNRIELVTYKKDGLPASNGFLIYQDVDYKIPKSPVSFSFRYALFDTDDYNSNIYAYENDVLYAYSIVSYYYRGSRFYMTSHIKIKRGIDFWLRYGQTALTNKQTIGSGYDVIQGNVRSEIKVQMRFTF